MTATLKSHSALACFFFLPFVAGATSAPVIEPYLELNGKPIPPAAVQISRTASAIKATLRAPSDGTYSFGIAISGDQLAPLTAAIKAYGCSSLKEPLVIHYPYDWTTRDPGLKIFTSQRRLVMPGLNGGGQIYLADTHELFSLRLEPCTHGNVRALLLAHRFFNDGGDRATPELPLRAGDKREFVVRIYNDIATANRDRFGLHDHNIRGNMTEIAFLEYAARSATENDTFFGNSGKAACCRALTPEEWQLAARKLQGVFQHAIIRTVQSSTWIPPIFHKRGILVYHYQYLGALRRWTPEVTPEVERDFALRDVKGQLYASPHAPDGNWLLVDIRRPEVRARLVENARSAVRSGFDGIFLDGWPFWADATGDIGGNVPSADKSWAYARWLLLREIKQAMRAENPKATLGVLTNHYYDSLGVSDWGMEEFMYGSWIMAERPSGDAILGHYRPASGTQVRKDKDVAYENNEALYQPGPIAYGAKGFSPIAVQSCLHFIRHPSGLYYTEAGTFPAADMEKWLDTIVSTFKNTDLYLSDIDPASCWVRFDGLATMYSKERCTVKFSRPVCIQSPDRKPAAGIETLTLEPDVRYQLSRECAPESRP